MQNAARKPGLSSTKTIAKVGVLSAIAYVLMFISVPLPIFPSFPKNRRIGYTSNIWWNVFRTNGRTCNSYS